MSKLTCGSALALALAFGCQGGHATDPQGSTAGPTTHEDDPVCPPDGGSGSGSGSGSDSGQATCLDRRPTGDTLWVSPQTAGYYLGIADIAVDANGNALYSRPGNDVFTNIPFGTTKIDASGRSVLHVDFGGVVATDAAGNTYIAGAFGAPHDFGTGVMQPSGIASIFLVELDASGAPVSVRDVAFPTDASQVDQSALGLAVTPDGSLFAVSSHLGTVVFDASGSEHYRTPYHGAVAFEPDRRLVINAFLEDLSSDSELLELDDTGCILWQQRFGVPGDFNEMTVARDLAIDRNGDIVAIGDVAGRSFLFGEEFVPDENTYFGGYTIRQGGYVVKVTAGGDLVWTRLYNDTELMLGVAIDPLGSIVVTGSAFTPVGGNNMAFITKLDAAGTELWRHTGVLGNTESAGTSVAVDACANILWAANAIVPNVGSASFAIELAP